MTHSTDSKRAVRRRVARLAFAALLLAAAGCGGREVEVTRPSRGRIEQSFAEPGKTRLANTYPVNAPVTGRIARIGLEPGTPVAAGQRLAAYDMVPFAARAAEAGEAVAQAEAAIATKSDNHIEDTVLAEAQELVKAAAEMLKASDEDVAAQQAQSDWAARELARVEAEGSAVSKSALDQARLTSQTAMIELRRQQFTRAATNVIVTVVGMGPQTIQYYIDLKQLQLEEMRHRLLEARSRATLAEHDLSLANVVSPVTGVVLERYSLGDAPVAEGAQLLLVGSLDDLEVEVDVLTEDALTIAPGTQVKLASDNGAFSVDGAVKRIEPQGFTKLSTLGVEEQRVKAIVSLAGPRDDLGVGYRLEARFVTATKDDALKVPRYSVLEAAGGSFYVFKVDGGRLKRTAVTVGLKTDLELEITSGLEDADEIVAQPDTTMTDGMHVSAKGGD